MSEASYFLGLEMSSSENGVLISQVMYILDLLDDFNMLEAKLAAQPLPSGIKLSAFIKLMQCMLHFIAAYR